MKREKTAAIVVDFQERLLPVMDKKEELISNSVRLLEGLKVLAVPMVVTQQYTKGLGETVPEIRAASGIETHVEKLAYSCYKETQVQEFIKDKEYLIVCGIEAHICVLQTVLDIKAAGKIPVLVTDCISSRKSFDKEMAMKRALQEGALLVTYESLLFELLERAGTPMSKAIQKIIR